MTIITLDRAYIVDRLNSLPPHSRQRSGLVSVMREITRRELEEERIGRELESALSEALSADPTFSLHAGLI